MLVVTNERAGRTEADSIEAVLAVLREGAEVELATCRADDDMEHILARRGDRRLVIIGGDGSLHTALRILRRRGEAAHCEVALIPLGTGNDFARGTGIPVGDPAAAARIALEGTPRPMDLIVSHFTVPPNGNDPGSPTTAPGNGPTPTGLMHQGDAVSAATTHGAAPTVPSHKAGRGSTVPSHDDPSPTVPPYEGDPTSTVPPHDGDLSSTVPSHEGSSGSTVTAHGIGIGSTGPSHEGDPGRAAAQLDEGVVVNAVHVGAGAEAALRARPLKRRLRIAAFPIGAVLAGLTTRGWRLRVRADGRLIARGRRRVLMAGLSNAPTIAGGTGRLGPDADPADGYADLTVSFAVGPLARAGYALALRRGDHPDRDDVVHLRAREVHISGDAFHVNADGELTGPFTEYSWHVVPAAWRLVSSPDSA